MAGSGEGPRPEDGASDGPTAEGSLEQRLRRLDQRLGKRVDRTARDGAQGRRRSDNSGFAYAMRLSTEFVSAILIGAGLGWAIDKLLGTGPWAMIVLFLLGFCAGILNVMRTAGRISDPYRAAESGGKDQTGLDPGDKDGQ